MDERRLYGDAKLIEALLEKLEKVEVSEGGWATVYRDAATGEFWLKYHTLSGLQGGGYLTLVKLPAPSTEQLIRIAIHSMHTDEAVAAILRLLDEEEVEKKDFRLSLIRHLEQQHQDIASAWQREHLIKVITLSKLTDPLNRREISGKSMQQIGRDAAYFREVADRASQLMSRLQ